MESIVDIFSVIDGLELPAAVFDGDLLLSYASIAFLNLTGLGADTVNDTELKTIIDKDSCVRIKEFLSDDSGLTYSKMDVVFINSGNRVSSKAVIYRITGEKSKPGILCILNKTGTSGNDDKKIQGELRKLRAVCIFAGGAAHDYNNALTAVMGNISLARLEAENNQELLELLRDAEKASSRIRQMTEKVSLFARGIKIERRKSRTEEVVRRSLSSALKGYSGSLNLDFQDGLPDLDIDPNLVSEAITCIVENACEAVSPENGKIEVSVSTEEVRETGRLNNEGAVEGNYVRVSVKDNGTGFKAEDSVLIFDPYYTTKKGREGVGLALANSIIKRHRGFITASSLQGGGSLFSVYIPLF